MIHLAHYSFGTNAWPLTATTSSLWLQSTWIFVIPSFSSIRGQTFQHDLNSSFTLKSNPHPGHRIAPLPTPLAFDIHRLREPELSIEPDYGIAILPAPLRILIGWYLSRAFRSVAFTPWQQLRHCCVNTLSTFSSIAFISGAPRSFLPYPFGASGPN